MSQQRGADYDSDLDEPLLDEDERVGDDGSEPFQNHDIMGGGVGLGIHGDDGDGVTLHGESVDVSHLFPSSGPGGGEGGHDMGNASGEEGGDGRATTPASTMSLDNGTANATNDPSQSPSALDYVKQTVTFLPRRGRALFYRTRYRVVDFVSTRRSRSGNGGGGGLTPVAADGGPSSTAANGDESSLSSGDRANSGRGGGGRITRNNNELRQKSALFRAPSTPLLLKLLIPPLLIANHVLFYHAQTKPMWNLAYGTNVTITATAGTLKAKAAADALNVPHHYEYRNHESKIVETFTYMDAIRKLWEGEGLGDAQTISKIAAALLVVFSGIWPHLKLLLVHLCWFLPFGHGLRLEGDLGDDDGDGDGGRRCCNGNGRSCGSRKRGSGGGGGDKSRKCGLCCSNGRSHRTRNLRSPLLRLLSTLGKWSLADVLVVCILIAVLHLDWEVRPGAIRGGIEAELPTLLGYAKEKYPDIVVDCTQLLGYTCGRTAQILHQPACLGCQALIKNAYSHPDWTAGEGRSILEGIDLDGGGHAQLRVQGMAGTYYFCAAVIASILLSAAVDRVDEGDRERVEEDLADRRKELEFILVGGEGEGEVATSMGNALELREESTAATARGRQHPPLNDAFSSDRLTTQSQRRERHSTTSRAEAVHGRLSSGSSAPIPSPTTNCHLLKHTVLALLSLSSLPLACYAVALPTMQRLVYGGGPTLLHEVLGMVWEKEYSLISLVETTGDAGGWDNFLLWTFGMFAVGGPIARSVCLILHVLLGLPAALLGDCVERPRGRTTLRVALYRGTTALRGALLPVIDTLGAFCCWEVLIVALIMIQLEMPSITDTIYQDDRCREADPEHGRTCIEVQFNALDNFLVVGIAWAVLVAASGLAMDLAADADQASSNIIGEEEDGGRYEFGQPIPYRRSNLNRDRAWIGSGKGRKGRVEEAGDRDEDEYYSPLQQGGGGSGRDSGLEQIVFV